jgi:hypothetical protein
MTSSSDCRSKITAPDSDSALRRLAARKSRHF